jgi:hypothetical protein
MAIDRQHLDRVLRLDCAYSLVWESVPGDTLSLHALHETNVGSEDRNPSQTSKDSDGRGKVVEDLESVTRSDEVGETHETSGKGECDVWDTSRGASGEDLGRVSVLGHSVEGSGSNVLVRVGGRDGEDQDTADYSAQVVAI